MFAIVITAITSFAMIGFSKNNKSLFRKIKIFFVEFIRKGHFAKLM